MTVTLTAPGRLHFGLFHVPVEGLTHWPDGNPVYQFGGLGLMVEEPSIRLTVGKGDRLHIGGLLAERAANFHKQVLEILPEHREQLAGLKIVADGPPEHVGLGVGTALGLSLAAACLRTLNLPRPDTPQELARLVNRGQRSGIGTFGFHDGGFLVDRGRLGSEPPEVEQRVDFPTDWPIILLRPVDANRWHGDSERSAFQRRRPPGESLRVTASLLSLAFTRIVPALRSRDFDSFCLGVSEFNRLAGEPFRRDQGGLYSGPEITRVIEQLQNWGHHGVGQSSWGPTAFCFTADRAEAEAVVKRSVSSFPFRIEPIITRANNTGFRLSEDEPS